jgi:hypothetical protein
MSPTRMEEGILRLKYSFSWDTTSRDWVLLFPAFRDYIMLSSSRVDLFKKTSDISAVEFETVTLSRNVGNRIASDAKSYTRWTFQPHCRENVKSLRKLIVLTRKTLQESGRNDVIRSVIIHGLKLI